MITPLTSQAELAGYQLLLTITVELIPPDDPAPVAAVVAGPPDQDLDGVEALAQSWCHANGVEHLVDDIIGIARGYVRCPADWVSV